MSPVLRFSFFLFFIPSLFAVVIEGREFCSKWYVIAKYTDEVLEKVSMVYWNSVNLPHGGSGFIRRDLTRTARRSDF